MALSNDAGDVLGMAIKFMSAHNTPQSVITKFHNKKSLTAI
jgi:hypothetical protein